MVSVSRCKSNCIKHRLRTDLKKILTVLSEFKTCKIHRETRSNPMSAILLCAYPYLSPTFAKDFLWDFSAFFSLRMAFIFNVIAK